MAGSSSVRVACIQMEPRFGATAANVAHSIALIEQAADQGANLVVLPELCNTGYMFETRAEAFSLAEPVPEGPSTKAWADVAARRNLIIVAGLAERDGDVLYNSAIVVGPGGAIGTYRKNHLWGAENLFFEPGNSGAPVFQTEIGRIGVAICYDGWFPELYRLQALQGADIVCVPTNWVPIPGQAEGREAMANILAMAAAHTNSLAIACADRIGTERGQLFIGQSLIIAHTGWPAAGPASPTDETVLVAEIDLGAGRRDRNWNAFNQPLRDRRTDLYAEMLGSDIRRGWY
ncbi:nitrilase family protein [Ancylobacter sp. 6x-1]|uniref:Nitrilase family protein n=1 Tax=Ancylobacter crimeensis TaxID=2579147 RepID=A0ABT0DFK0_9HYPH|nr:nitrilase family protein [Ancylobacter crimeensis]MCK0198751.1 nitrilase family protein [Ancylobacter crimeensis]